MPELLRVLQTTDQEGSGRGLKNLLAVLRVPAAILDHMGQVIETNTSWSETYGDLINHVAPDQSDQVLKDGRYVRFNRQTSPDEIHALCLAVDITDLKSVSKSGVPYRYLLEELNDCVKLIDTAGRLLFVNKSGRKVLGLEEDQPLGMLWVDLLPETARNNVAEILDQVMAGDVTEFSNRSQFPGKEMETWHHILTPYRDYTGRVIAALCVSRKVTTAYTKFNETRAKEERLELAMKACGLGVMDLDIATGRIYCDEQFFKIVGMNTNSAISTLEQLLPHIHPDDIERISNDWQLRDKAYENGARYKTNFRVITQSGEVRTVQLQATVLKDLADRPARAIGTISLKDSLPQTQGSLSTNSETA